MHGFPRQLSSKYDYEYVRKHFPADQWRPAWARLLAGRFSWLDTAILKETDAGVRDGTHRVIERETPNGAEERIQQEIQEDPNAHIFRMGFTVEEVARALES